MKLSLKNSVWALFVGTTVIVLGGVFLFISHYFQSSWTNDVQHKVEEEVQEIEREGSHQLKREIDEGEYFIVIPSLNLYTHDAVGFDGEMVPAGDYERLDYGRDTYLVTGFIVEGEEVGMIGVSIRNHLDTQHQLNEILRDIGGAVLLLVALIGFVFSRVIIQPIRRLSAQVSEVDFDHLKPGRIVVGKNERDELVVLQKTFRETLERLKQYNQEQMEFISFASHEFRTPLTVIQTSLDLAKKYPSKIEEAKEEVKYLVELTNQLLLLTKLGHAVISFSVVDVSKVMKKELKKWETRFKEKEIELNIEFEKGILIETNQEVFITVVRNLLGNALKFCSKKGVVNVVLNKKYFSVENSYGKKVDIKKITQAFYQEDRYEKNEGVGMGLCLVMKASKALGLVCQFKSTKGKFEVTISFPK
jgi:signal transduction histidine kinase